ncbi:MAG: TetR/AcrR family transcriptional regulator [Polaromonas sp.]
MSTSNRSTYHHGDLKAALLLAANALLEEGGEAAISVREVARRAGVSPTATYRHFEDRSAMLAALATQGFESFAEDMKKASAQSPEPFAEMGVAYVRFAVDHPGMFRLMFGPSVADRSRSPDLVAAIAKSTRVFNQGMEACKGVISDSRLTALRSWALVHGLSMLVLDGMLPGFDAETLARAVTKSAKPNPGGGSS